MYFLNWVEKRHIFNKDCSEIMSSHFDFMGGKDNFAIFCQNLSLKDKTTCQLNHLRSLTHKCFVKHKCEGCGNYFKTEDYLASHVTMIHNNCHICGKIFRITICNLWQITGDQSLEYKKVLMIIDKNKDYFVSFFFSDCD